jgi:hypothetical protein
MFMACGVQGVRQQFLWPATDQEKRKEADGQVTI